MQDFAIERLKALLPTSLCKLGEEELLGHPTPMCWIAVYESADRNIKDDPPDVMSGRIDDLHIAAKKAIQESRVIRAYLLISEEVQGEEAWSLKQITSAFKVTKSHSRDEPCIYHLAGGGCFMAGEVSLEELKHKTIVFSSLEPIFQPK